ncbi:thiol-disulfide oxidoreductase DCC family protein [Aurantivibrio infirmus]
MNASLFYDGTCPLCSREITVLRRLSNGRMNFIDIHQVDKENIPSKEALLKRLHLRKTDGTWLIGLDANVYAWSQTPYGILFKILRIWPVRIIADAIYNRWADQRFKKRYQCKACLK